MKGKPKSRFNFEINPKTKKERKQLTDFYMWMVENEYDHNIRIRVETKAELFLREQEKNSCKATGGMPILEWLVNLFKPAAQHTK